jgi:hypothetical protein
MDDPIVGSDDNHASLTGIYIPVMIHSRWWKCVYNSALTDTSPQTPLNRITADVCEPQPQVPCASHWPIAMLILHANAAFYPVCDSA